MRPSVLCIIALVCLSAGFVEAALVYPLRVSDEGRHLVDQTGQAILFNADSPWHVVTRLNQAETELFLNDRQSRGFNSMLVSILVADGFLSGSTENIFGDPPFLVPGDFSAPNEAYFAHLDWFLQQADARGITIFLCPAYIGWVCGAEGFCQDMIQSGAATMRDYGRWLGARYEDQPNIVWVHGGDANAGVHGAMDVVDAVAEGILETDREHLHTAHCGRFTLGSDCYDRPWLDFDTSYADCAQTPAFVKRGYELTPPRPVLYIEGRYEYELDWTPECLRSQAYWAVLGGSAGHFFGSGKLWDFPADWASGLDSEGSTSMLHFMRLLSTRSWSSLVPDYTHQILTSGYGDIDSDAYAAAALSADGETILTYTPTPRPLTFALDSLTGASAEAWWYDPANGEGIFAGIFPSTGSRTFSPPGGGDWVLVIDNVAADLVDVWNEATAVRPPAVHGAVSLEPPSPNPFNPRSEVAFTAAPGSPTTVKAYDARGREVALLFEGLGTGARQLVVWEATDFASGTYFLRLDSGGRGVTRKVAIVK